MDVLTKKQRSKNMRNIRSTNTLTELSLRKVLWRKGLRYRLHAKMPGKPDIVFRPVKIAVFVDGCFWHKCPKCYVEPATRKGFWLPKLEKNTKRDKAVNRMLRKQDWIVLRFWEHQIRKSPEKVAHKIAISVKQRS
jgi:DNA mismatch endonuclease, patch repair protein